MDQEGWNNRIALLRAEILIFRVLQTKLSIFLTVPSSRFVILLLGWRLKKRILALISNSQMDNNLYIHMEVVERIIFSGKKIMKMKKRKSLIFLQ